MTKQINFGRIAVKMNNLAKKARDRATRQGLYKLKTYLASKAIQNNQIRRLSTSLDNTELMEVTFRCKGDSRVHVPMKFLNQHLKLNGNGK